MKKFTERIKKALNMEKNIEYPLPYIPPLKDYTIATRKTIGIQEGDVVVIMRNDDIPKSIKRGYVGIVLQNSKDCPTNCYKVIFGSDYLQYKESKYVRTGVFFIKKDALMRCYLNPLSDFSDANKD